MKSNMNEMACIVLFVYARPEHTQKTLNALAQNYLSDKSHLIIYADAARKIEDRDRVRKVKDICRNIEGFMSVTLVEREVNYGLARNIVEGVTEVVNKYGAVIVLEDDMITSPYFLTYMNQALDKYANEFHVWHISGWNYPIAHKDLGDAFFWRLMNCWGWGTWADRWQYFEKNPTKLIDEWSRDEIQRFNMDGALDYWGQVKSNYDCTIDTWAIFWYATIFKNNGLCLNATNPLVANIGLDGSGEHCGVNDVYNTSMLPVNSIQFPCDVTESQLAVKYLGIFAKNHLHPSYFKRILSKIKRLFRSLFSRLLKNKVGSVN
jgi:hypothetical protein